jgi:uncharacterized protein (DUF3084 family)
MANYHKILETLEENVKKISNEKERAEKERDKAIYEVKVVRQRYINIVGAE